MASFVAPLTAAQAVLACDALCLLLEIIDQVQGLWLSEDGASVAVVLPTKTFGKIETFDAGREDLEDGGDLERCEHH